jgi:hypothetical protein
MGDEGEMARRRERKQKRPKRCAVGKFVFFSFHFLLLTNFTTTN